MKRSFIFLCMLLAVLILPSAELLYAQPEILGECNLHWGAVRGLTIYENYVFAGTVQTGLRIVDISDQDNPVELGGCYTPGWAYDIQVVDNYAFVADNKAGLTIVDISDLTDPHVIGNLSFGDNNSVRKVCVVDNYAYLASMHRWLIIADISNPQNPTLVDIITIDDVLQGITASGQYIFLAESEGGIEIMDISDPENPTHVSDCQTAGQAQECLLEDDILYVADTDSGLAIIDVSDIYNPEYLCNESCATQAIDLTKVDNFIYLVDWRGCGIYSINVSDPANPSTAEFLQTPSYASAIAHNGEYTVYSTSNVFGIFVLDLMIAPAMINRSNFSKPGEMNGLTVNNGYVYASDFSNGLSEINVTNVNNPQIVNNVPIDGLTFDITSSDNYCYVSGAYIGMQIYDIGTPGEAQLISTYNLIENPMFIKVHDNFAYVSDFFEGMHIIDVQDPEDPLEYSLFPTPENEIARDIWIQDTLAYFSINDAGMSIVDISNPLFPEEIGRYDAPCRTFSSHVIDNIAYVACSFEGMRIVDVSNPALPVEIGSYVLDDNSPTQTLAVADGIAYINFDMGQQSELHIVDVSDPSNPVLIEVFDNFEHIHDINIVDNLVYFTDVYSLFIMDLYSINVKEEPAYNKITSMNILSTYPNPFNSNLTIKIQMPCENNLNLRLYNINGQLVDVLNSDIVSSGIHSFNLNSHKLAAGTYFIRAQIPGNKIETRKIVYLP